MCEKHLRKSFPRTASDSPGFGYVGCVILGELLRGGTILPGEVIGGVEDPDRVHLPRLAIELRLHALEARECS